MDFHSMGRIVGKLWLTMWDFRGVRHDYAALEEQLLDVAQAWLEAKIPSHRATDDLCLKTVAVIDLAFFISWGPRIRKKDWSE
jgi:hypothetical protein